MAGSISTLPDDYFLRVAFRGLKDGYARLFAPPVITAADLYEAFPGESVILILEGKRLDQNDPSNLMKALMRAEAVNLIHARGQTFPMDPEEELSERLAARRRIDWLRAVHAFSKRGHPEGYTYSH
jgi:hypothetical protein